MAGALQTIYTNVLYDSSLLFRQFMLALPPTSYIKEVFCVSRLEEHLERAYLEFPVLVELIELNAQCVA